MDMELICMIIIFTFVGVVFGGLRLWMCRKFSPSEKILVEVNRAMVRAVDARTFDYQIDLYLETKWEDAYLEYLAFSHPAAVFVAADGTGSCVVERVANGVAGCLLDGNRNGFSGAVEKLSHEGEHVNGMRVSAVERRHISVVNRIRVGLSPEYGEWLWPQEGWALSVRTSMETATFPFAFTVHESNDVAAFCNSYMVPSGSTWSCSCG